MKGLQDKQQGLRVRLRNNQREIHRLMTEYENFGAVVVTGQDVPGMDEWLVNSRPKRRAVATQSPNPLDNTQCTDASTQPSQPSVGESMISDAASDALEHPNFSDDYTDSSDEVEDEERSVNTDTGLPDTQASDSPYLTRPDKKKKKKRKQKKENKKAKRSSKKMEERKSGRRKKSPPRSPSY